ncbi:SDR family NAD(P)-dependent oxidoreductase [Sphingomonas oryzagri]
MQRPRRLVGKRALVTGASRGIGRAVCDRLAAEGANVMGVARHFDHPAASLDQSLVADLATPLGRGELLEAVQSSGGLDLLVNAAGSINQSTEKSEDVDRDTFELNFWAPVILARNLSGYLTLRRGSIINISSVVAQRPQVGSLAYCASKSALEIATRCLAQELGSAGIRVNGIAPGPIPTRLLATALDGSDPDFMRSHIPLGRLGRPEDIASTVAFLASDDADWISGEIIRVDGGMMS